MRALLLLGPLLLGCGDGVIQRVGGPRDPLQAPIPGRLIQIEAQPADVDIYIDGAYKGRLDGYRMGVLRLDRGAKRLRLSKAGFEDWYGLIPPDERIKVVAELIPKVR